jgi:hypothetical protein
MIRPSAFVALVGAALLAGVPAGALQDCIDNCAQLSIGSAAGRSGSTVTIPVSFTQGPDDSQPGQGNDEIAALAFTVGIPGTGDGAPLEVQCVDGDGDGTPDNIAQNAVVPSAAISDDFTVVVENAQCTNRDRCLCPTGDQKRDDFVNIVVYGPKDLPAQGPVQIPVLPNGGQILTLNLRIAARTQQVIPLHVFAEQDDGLPAKPSFSAYASIGDQAAIDETADRGADRSKIRFSDGMVTVEPGGCAGDCDYNDVVAINELVKGVNIALGSASLGDCSSFDLNDNGRVDINELIAAVNNALNGCSP